MMAHSAEASITWRQPNSSINRREGTPAATAPIMPTKRPSPVANPNSLGAIQTLAILIMPTKATPADAPINKRPTPAQSILVASANKRLPPAAINAPNASSFLGPQRSTKIPVGICMAT